MLSGRTRSMGLAGSVAALLGAAGCTTTGLAWVHEPESGVDLSPPSGNAVSSPQAPNGGSATVASPAGPVTRLAATADLQDAPRARRIDRTITLGETTGVMSSAGPAQNQPGGPSSPVVINIYVQQSPAPGYYGAGYGLVSGVSSFRGGGRSVAARSATMSPGMDWAPPPSYGPAFPYRMGPSSPWVGDGGDRTRSSR